MPPPDTRLPARRTSAVAPDDPASPPPPDSSSTASGSPELPPGFARQLIDWQRVHGRRTLPWQNTRDPYRVWLSEVMLQQTQVATVLGYYPRFLTRFPDVAALAAAPLDDVLALWSGLGYYGRARNLHACARAVAEQHAGRFPASAAGLLELPGVGRSTAAAIAAFCYGERVAILDGNVKRVLTRLLGFEADLTEPRHERALWELATGLLPETGIEAYTQGLMDLGATVCTPRAPSCLLCPVRDLCVAARAGTQARYPVKTRKLKRGVRSHVWLWLVDAEGRTLLVQRPPTGVWAGLWSFPQFDTLEALEVATAGWPGHAEPLPSFKHVVTHFDWTLQPVRWRSPPAAGEPSSATTTGRWPTGRWFEAAELPGLALPSPVRRLLDTPAVP